MKKTTFSKGCAAALAATLVCTTINLNPVEVFAKENTPITLTTLSATPLDVRSYHGSLGDFNVDLDIPEIGTNKAITRTTNKEIQSLTDTFLTDAQKEFVDYKDSFFATGGTEKDWADRKMYVMVDYDVTYNQNDLLSMKVTTATGWFSFAEQDHFYNLDLKNNKVLTLEGLLGKDYVKICNDSILKQMAERTSADEGILYFTPEEGGFQTITADTAFYLNNDGDVVVSFPKYEIAPGAMGAQEFVIQK